MLGPFDRLRQASSVVLHVRKVITECGLPGPQLDKWSIGGTRLLRLGKEIPASVLVKHSAGEVNRANAIF